MRKWKKTVARAPIVGRSLLALYRARRGASHFQRPLFHLLKWLLTSREATNFTYDLEETNRWYLASLIAEITNEPLDSVTNWFKELESDGELHAHIAETIRKSKSSYMTDREVRFGRRLGWYALARILKPKVVVETGVDKGLGACVLTAALKRNSQEGYSGRYYGTDIDREAGYLLCGVYADYGEILYGDSIETLVKFDHKIDLFINDSDHSTEYEAQEYKTIAHKLSDHAMILGDNSHQTDKLIEFSVQTNRHFVFFQEKPKDHWFPGAGIGISFKRRIA